VSEVLGYVLMFFLSASVLVLSLQALTQSFETTATVQAGSELKQLSDNVANAVLKAGFAASNAPNSTYEVRLPLPELKDRAYYLNATNATGTIWANTTDGKISASAAAFNVQQIGGLQLAGTVYNSQGYVKVRFSTLANGQKTILLTI